MTFKRSSVSSAMERMWKWFFMIREWIFLKRERTKIKEWQRGKMIDGEMAHDDRKFETCQKF